MSKYLRSIVGQSLIELIVVLGLLSVLLPALITGIVSSRGGEAQQKQRLEATSLLKEAAEAVRNIKYNDWNSFAAYAGSPGDPLYLRYDQTNHTWQLAHIGNPTPTPINGFTRTITINNVNRDANGNIVLTGGANDPSTKKVTITVSWSNPYASSIDSTFYLTRLDNLTDFDTTICPNSTSCPAVTPPQFGGGNTQSTAIVSSLPKAIPTPQDGEVVLGGGYGEWCKPNLSIVSLDLPKQGVANAISAVQGHISVGTGENASGISYAHVTVTDTHPPVANISGTFDGYKTNDIWTDSQYAYIATDNNSKEVVIIDITGAPTEIGYFNTPLSSTDATSVFVSGNRGYVTAGSFLYVFDLSSKTGSRPIVGLPFLLLGTGTSIAVNGNYAYISISNSPIEMQIINITNPSSLFQTGFADVNGQDGKKIFVNETATRAYLVTNASTNLREFFIIDIQQKSGSRPTIGSYEANGMNPKSLAIVPGNKAIIVGSGGEEYQVIDITDETKPIRCGGIQIDSGINGISSVLEADGDAFSYIITGDQNSELKIIEGGPGGGTGVALNGTFTSRAFVPGGINSTAFNKLIVNYSQPSGTTLTFKVASANVGADGTCATANYNFVGPNLDTTPFPTPTGSLGPVISTTYSIPFGTISSYTNPGFCFKYQANFESTDTTRTPVLYDVTLNYSP